MKEMNDLFNYCINHYDKSSCQECAYKNCMFPSSQDCYSCLQKIHHYNNNTLYYQCKNIRYNYILKFFNRYASEISYCLLPLFKKTYYDVSHIVIYSLGCGPSSELYAAIAMARKAGKNESTIE